MSVCRIAFSPSMAAALIALASGAVAQSPAPCPAEIADAKCWSGKDANGSYYWAAMPSNWNNILVVHAHGGPRTAEPQPNSSVEDLLRFAVVVKAGYAWIGPSYRRGGYGVRMALEDTEAARRIFVEHIAKPRRVILHGQSWGGNVAAKMHETLPDFAAKYDGVLLTSGVLGGGTHGYDYRIDLRAVYNFYCRNHPRPDEQQYKLNIGLPADSKMTVVELAVRVDECTGIKLPAAQRSAAQQRSLANILATVKLPERSLQGHMNWATFLFRDIVAKRLDGNSPFGNQTVRYAGSDDDAALNAGVARMAAHPLAVAKLAEDSDLTGALIVPTLTLHAIDDPIAFVEHESRYADSVNRAGKASLLVQAFVAEREHSFLTAPAYATALAALVDWIDKGSKPSARSLADACPNFIANVGGTCSFRPEYHPEPYAARVYPR